MSAVLSVRVDGSDRVRVERDDRQGGGEANLGLDRAERRVIELFGDWLAEGWAQPGQRKITRRRELETFGMLLHARLFPGELARVVDEAVQAARPDDPVRIELVFVDGAEGLALLPWEYLYAADRDGVGGYFLATDARVALSRYMPLPLPVAAIAPETPLRLLATAARPSDLGTVREEATLAALRALDGSARVDVRVLERPTVERLIEALAGFRPHVLHLLAHGEYDEAQELGRIALERGDGTAHWLADHQLVQVLARAAARPSVVLLHACEGGAVGYSAALAGLAPSLTRAGVPAVVAMQYPVTNAAAGAFAGAFYEALGAERPIDSAVQAGRSDMTERNPASYDTGEFGIPVLYLRTRTRRAVAVR